MMKSIRVKDLPDSTLHTGVHLSCPMCGDTWSATAGDYFWLPLETIMRCQNDNTPLRLTRTVSQEESIR